jgi:hypothetical protein
MKTSKSPTITENRKMHRSLTELKTVVKVKESEKKTWKEITKVTTVSRNGAGFILTRKCTVGQLVTLVLPLPPELRAYDRDEELYPVLGLVQFCNETALGDETAYNIGVGFVGKHIPDSFKANPQQSYRICGMKKDGLWLITEAETPFKPRRDPRFWLQLEVAISLIKKEKKSTNKENTVTKNISSSGVSVFCTLDVNIGDKVKFACKEHDFYAIAIVRNRKERNGQTPTLHLEFVEDKFPIEKLILSQTLDAGHTEEASGTEAYNPPPQISNSGQFEFERYEI